MNTIQLRLRALVLLSIFVYMTSPSSHAAALIWTNTAGGLWSNTNNWSPNVLPTAADTAVITNSGTYVITNNATVNITALTLGDTNSTGTPTLYNSSAFTVTNTTVASNGVIAFIAGTFTTAGPANIAGTFNQNIGTWQLNAAANINNYTLTNGELRGANCVITNFTWLGGSLNSDTFGTTTTVPSGGTLTLAGATGKTMSYWAGAGRTLNNFGTGTWTGAGIIGNGSATLNNGGTLTLNGDFGFAWGGSGAGPVLNNTGTLIKTTGTGAFTLTSSYFNNFLTCNIGAGSFALNSCVVTNQGAINLAPNAFFDLNSGTTARVEGILNCDSGDHFRFQGATVTLATPNITTPSLLLSSGLLNQNTNVAVNTMNQLNGTWQLNVPIELNNYNLTNGELRGANCVITNLNWVAGSLNSDALGNVTTIPVGGTLTISGATTKGLSYYVAPGRTLNNNGTATWTGAGINGQDRATINNNGTMTLNGDFTYAWAGAGSAPIFNNNGTLTKASGAGAFTLSSIILNNNNALNISSGSLTLTSSQFHNNGTNSITAGTIAFNSSSGTNRGAILLGAGSFADFNAGSTYVLEGALSGPTADSFRIQGATVSLNTTNVATPSLALSSGLLNQNTNVVVNTLNQAAGTWQLNIPITINNYNITNGELRGANCVITNLNWVGGGLNADTLGNVTTIPIGGTLNISGPNGKGLSYYVAPGRTLNNNGTATWSGAGILGYSATFNNNGTLTINGDVGYSYGGSGNAPVFNNNGTMTKASGTGQLLFTSAYFNNYLTCNIGSGSIALNASVGTNVGGIYLSPGAFLDFNASSVYQLGGIVNCDTGDHIRVQGATVDLTTTNITTPSLLITAGQLNQNAPVVVNTLNQSAGVWRLNLPAAINNYNLTNGELRGANITITNFNWIGGSLNSENSNSNTVTIPLGGNLTIAGATAKGIGDYSGVSGRRVVNNGTATWSGANITGYYAAQIVNNNLFNITSDLSLVYGGAGTGPFLINNAGSTINLTSGTDLGLTTVNYLNSGTINLTSGSITFTSCAGTNTATGLLNLDATSFVNFDSGALTVDGTFLCPAGDHFRVRGMTVNLATTNVFTPSLLITAGQLNQNADVVVNTLNQANGTWRLNVPAAINNYNFTNGELRGANVIITNFNWQGGQLSSENASSNTVTVPSGGTLTIASATAKTLYDYSAVSGRRLINNGTGTWSGAGIVGYYAAQIVNNNLFNITSDLSYVWSGAGTGPFFINTATVNLASGTDFGLSTVNYLNSGTINLTNGSITFTSCAGTNTASGLLNLDATSFVNFDSGALTVEGTFLCPAGDHFRVRGMTVNLATTNVFTPSLLITAGQLNQNADVVVNTLNQANGTWRLNVPAAINNYNFTNGELRGANVIITNFNWQGGQLSSENASSNTVTVPSGGTLTIASATAKTMYDYSAVSGRRLINNGTGTWSGTGITGYYGSQLVNNNLLNITSDLSYVWSGAGTGPFFINTATVNLASGTDFGLSTVNYLNSGTINLTNGSITFTSCAGTNTASGLLNLDATSFVNFDSGALTVEGTFLCPAGDHFRVRGMTVNLATTNVFTPSLLITAGQLNQNADVVVNTLNQANGTWRLNVPAAINNYNFTNGELRGANVIITNFNWQGGQLSSENASSNTVTVPSGGTLTIASATAKTMYDYSAVSGRRLINNGTGTWSGTGITGYYGSQLVNNNLFNITSDLSYVWSGAGTGPFFINTATVNLASGTDFGLSTVNYLNSGTINATNGSLTFTGCAGTNTATGLLSFDATSFVNFDSGTLNVEGTLLCPAGDHFRVRGMTVNLATTNVFTPSLLITAGQLNQNADVVVNTLNQANGTWRLNVPAAINNYNFTNGEFRGANVTITNFNWQGGGLTSENANSNSVIVPNGGNLTIGGATSKTLSDYAGVSGRRLINNGTGTWSGANITGYYDAQLINQSTLTLSSDAGFVWSGFGAAPTFRNLGTFTKNAGTGIAAFTSTTITNSGTFTVNSGGITVGGQFIQTAGSTTLGTNFTASSNVRIEAGSFAGRGNIAGTFYNNGSSSPGASPGLITGSTLTNSPLGTLRFEIGGTNPGTNFDQFRLTGPAIIDGTADLSLANGFVPVPGNTFTSIVCSARSGTFSNLTFSGGYVFTALYTPTTVVFRAENALPTASLVIAPTQLVCQPFSVTANAFDVGGVVTNTAIILDGNTIASATGNTASTSLEIDFPGIKSFIAQAIDDQGGVSYATQNVAMVTLPLHTLSMGPLPANDSFKFCMLGLSSSNYTVVSATNITIPPTNWVPVGAMEYTNGIFRYTVSNMLTNGPFRYYRAKLQ